MRPESRTPNPPQALRVAYVPARSSSGEVAFECDANGGSLADFGVDDGDLTLVVLLDDAARERQPEAPAAGLGRESRFEDAFPVALGNAFARVFVFLVVADETVVSAISDRDASRVHREFRVQVDLDGTEEEKLAFVDPLLAADANDVYSVISHQDNAVDLYTMYGGFLFLGVFLGLLFLLSTVLIIYYKQISEGYEDQRRYQIMQQVGMSPREVRSSIRSQVLLVFFLPLVTAGIHVAAAFPMLCKLLELFNLFDVRLFALCAAGTLLVFCAIYALVYGLTTRTYSRIVGGQ